MGSIYIAGSYTSREELLFEKKQMLQHGFIISSAWLNGDHEGVHPELAAVHDLRELQEGSCIIVDFHYNNKVTIGKTFEMGCASAWGLDIMVIGDGEGMDKSVFKCMVDMWVPTWDMDLIIKALALTDVDRFPTTVMHDSREMYSNDLQDRLVAQGEDYDPLSAPE